MQSKIFAVIIVHLSVMALGSNGKINKTAYPAFKKEYIDKLPKNFAGIDQLRLLKSYRNNRVRIKKDEFETLQEYSMRLDSAYANNRILSKDSLYAFSVNLMRLRYDAESQEYVMNNENSSEYHCSESLSSPNPGWIMCPTMLIAEKRRRSIQSNAFGATVEVAEYDRDILSIAIPKLGAINRDFLVSDYESYVISKKIPLSRDIAKKFKGKTMLAIFVGYPTSMQVLEGRGELRLPTIDFPSKFSTSEFAIPINLEWLIIYEKESGEIIERFDIRDFRSKSKNEIAPAPF